MNRFTRSVLRRHYSRLRPRKFAPGTTAKSFEGLAVPMNRAARRRAAARMRKDKTWWHFLAEQMPNIPSRIWRALPEGRAEVMREKVEA